MVDRSLLDKFHNDQGRDAIARRAMISSLTCKPRDPMFKLQLMELQMKYTEIEANTGASTSNESRVMDGFWEALRGLRFTVNSTASREPPSGMTPGGVEYRADELMRMAQGETVILPGGLDTAEFPTRRSVHDDDEVEKEDDPTLREGE
jgi:hypothetical protein